MSVRINLSSNIDYKAIAFPPRKFIDISADYLDFKVKKVCAVALLILSVTVVPFFSKKVCAASFFFTYSAIMTAYLVVKVCTPKKVQQLKWIRILTPMHAQKHMNMNSLIVRWKDSLNFEDFVKHNTDHLLYFYERFLDELNKTYNLPAVYSEKIPENTNTWLSREAFRCHLMQYALKQLHQVEFRKVCLLMSIANRIGGSDLISPGNQLKPKKIIGAFNKLSQSRQENIGVIIPFCAGYLRDNLENRHVFCVIFRANKQGNGFILSICNGGALTLDTPRTIPRRTLNGAEFGGERIGKTVFSYEIKSPQDFEAILKTWISVENADPPLKQREKPNLIPCLFSSYEAALNWVRRPLEGLTPEEEPSVREFQRFGNCSFFSFQETLCYLLKCKGEEGLFKGFCEFLDNKVYKAQDPLE